MADVNQSIVVEKRPLYKLRISRMLKEYGQEGYNFIDKDATEAFFTDLKQQTKLITHMTWKKTLSVGLQAAHQMKRITTQTHFQRTVDKIVAWDPDDFNKENQDKLWHEMSEEEQKAKIKQNEKIEKFIDRVAYSIEQALQSNEIINVFQDDF